MNREETVAYINGQVAMALIELESMKAHDREHPGQSYVEEAYLDLSKKYDISYIDITTLFERASQ